MTVVILVFASVGSLPRGKTTMVLNAVDNYNYWGVNSRRTSHDDNEISMYQ